MVSRQFLTSSYCRNRVVTMQSEPDPNDIGNLCINKFKNLPKTGKPSDSEWTVLSCILLHDSKNATTKVVGLGTGTKCIGHTEMCPKGFILNDSHAEVIARRTFLRYIYYQLKHGGGDKVFSYNNDSKSFKLNPGFTFHFFSTHPPCGDASIFVESIEETHDCEQLVPMKKRKINIDDVCTGAKLIDSNASDLMDQEVGQLRTKPGRGIRTLSMSCSDKIARWNILGIQGALLDSILEEPLYIKTYNFCGDFNLEAFSRALFKRWYHKEFTHSRYKKQEPQIRHCSKIHFFHSQSDLKEPSPASISWCDVPKKALDIAVCGKRQGVTKKNLNLKMAALLISKAALLEEYLKLLEQWPELKEKLELNDNITDISYKEIKDASKAYQDAWKQLQISYFEKWTKKPDNLLDFMNKD